MALVRCPECGREVAADAPTCPNCGTPVAARRAAAERAAAQEQEKRSRGKAFIFILALILFIGIASAINDSNDSAPVTSGSTTVADTVSKITQTTTPTPARRVAFAEEYEKQQLSQGRDVTARATGTDGRTLRIKWVLVSRPLAYQMSQDSKVIRNLQSLGFRRVVLEDGYDETYSFTIDPLPGDTGPPAPRTATKRRKPQWIADPKLEVFYYSKPECGPAQALLRAGGYQTFATAEDALEAGYRRSDTIGCDD